MNHIIRTYTAGVFYGQIEYRQNKEVAIKNARRLWYWSGAASLSQIAQEGVKKPEECKFACPVNKIVVTEAIEILECTEEASKNIEAVPLWKA